MFDEGLLLAAVTAAFLLAGFIKGVIGLGLPTVAIALLSLAMAPAEAAALIVVPSLVTNLWQMAAGRRLMPLLRRLWPMLLGICAGTWAGAGLITGEAVSSATAALGAALVLYAIVGLTSPRFSVPARAEPWLSPLIGTATGMVTAATGVLVIPAVPYLQALALEKEDLVQALGLSFTISTLALAAALARDGVLQGLAVNSLLVLAPALAGILLGQWVRVRVRPETFRLWILAGLLLLGGHLATPALLAAF